MTETAKEAARRLSGPMLDKGFRPVALHAYTDDGGQPLYYRVRMKHPDTGEKWIRPIHCNGNGWELGEPKMEGAKPLYRLHKLVKRSSEPVWYVEGENCADALAKVGLLATTAGSAQSDDRADFQPLAGRAVTIWPDNDTAGKAHAERVAAKLLSLCCAVETIDAAALDLPEKADCVDWLAAHAGATPADLMSLPRVKRHDASPRPNEGVATWTTLEPMPALPAVQSLNYNALPAVLREYVRDISERMQCPADFPAAVCLAMASAAIGRQIGIRPKRIDNWTVIPNLWAMIVGRSGIMKSPAMDEALAPIRSMQAEAFKRHDEARREYELGCDIAKLKADDAKKKASAAVKKGNHDEAQRLLANARDEAAEQPTVHRYIINDSTVEALAETLEENPNGVLVDRDELAGWLHSLDKEGQQEARAFYLTGADGNKGFTTDRITRGRGRHIDAVCISIAGGIQPGVLAQYVRETQRGGSGDDGLLQRFGVIVYPDIPKEWQNIDRGANRAARLAVDEAVARLLNLDISAIGGETDPYQPVPFIHFDEPAQTLFDEWREELEQKLRSDEEHPAVVSHLSKYRKLVPSLALINHLCDNNHGPVTECALAQALMMADYLESHARRVYSYASRPDVEGAKMILAKIRAGKLPATFKAAKVYRAGWSGLSTSEEAWAAIRLLVDLGYLRETLNDQTGGAPSRTFEAHPTVRVCQ